METTVNSYSRSSASYLKELDIAKAIGIILVVYGHFYIEFTSKSAPEFAVARVIYLFHMPLFFALTGLTNGIYGKRAASHFKSDLKKLFVPYIIWSFIYLLAIILVRGVIPGKMDKLPGILSERFLAFVTGRGIAPIWFLLALFLGRTVYDLIRRAISFDKRKNRVLVLLALGAISLVSIAIFKKLSAMLPGTENTVYRYLLITFFRIPLTVFFLIEGECIGRNWAWFKKLKNAADKALPLKFIKGNGEYVGIFVIEQIKESTEQTSAKGDVISIQLEVKLKEFAGKIPEEKNKQKGFKKKA